MMKKGKRELGIIHLAPLFVVVLLLGTFIFSTKKEKVNLEQTKSAVLSEEDDNSGSGSSGSSSDSSGSGSGEDRSDDDSNSGSSEDDLDDDLDDDNSGPGSSDDDDNEIETEVRTTTGVRIRTREQKDERRIDIYEGGRHLKIRTRNGVTTVTVEDEEGEELEEDELEDDEEVEVEATGGAKIRIRKEGTGVTLRHGLVNAHTNFPISVNQDTGELTITTPAGEKIVTVLPEAAVQNMLAANVIDRVLAGLVTTSTPEPVATDEAEVEATPSGTVDLEEEDDELVYIIDGISEQKLLGIFDVFVPRTAVVSAESGDLLEIRQTLIDRILDLISF